MASDKQGQFLAWFPSKNVRSKADKRKYKLYYSKCKVMDDYWLLKQLLRLSAAIKLK